MAAKKKAKAVKKVARKKAKAKAAPKVKVGRGEGGRPYFRGKGGNGRVHADMLTIALRGPEAEEMMRYMEKHHLNGAQLLREGYKLYKEAHS